MAKKAVVEHDKIDLMDLRLCAIQYKLSRGIRTTEELRKKAGIVCGRNDLARFLSGDTNDFKPHRQLADFLEAESFWPAARGSTLVNETIAHFIETESKERVENELSAVSGDYECVQWSSTQPGMVLISSVSINFDQNNASSHAFVTETQVDKESEVGEIYVGCCMFSNKGMIFVLRERKQNRLKLIICDKFRDGRISGLMLKSSTKKSVHLSQVSMRRTNDPIDPRMEYMSKIGEADARQLEEPLTSFDLSNRDTESRQRRDAIRMIMRKFQREDGPTSEVSEATLPPE